MDSYIRTIEMTLRRLVAKNKAAINAYTKAAEKAKDRSIAQYFENKVEARTQFLTQLRRATPVLDLDRQENPGSMAVAETGPWVDYKGLLSKGDDESMLEESVRGDKATLLEYNQILGGTQVPVRIKEIIRQQRETIQNDLKTTRVLEL